MFSDVVAFSGSLFVLPFGSSGFCSMGSVPLEVEAQPVSLVGLPSSPSISLPLQVNSFPVVYGQASAFFGPVVVG